MLHGSADCEVYVADLVANLCKLLEEYNLEKMTMNQPLLPFLFYSSHIPYVTFNKWVVQKRPTTSRMKYESGTWKMS